MTSPRRTFGPVVLLVGLASGAVVMAGTQPWHTVTSNGESYRCEAPCVGISANDTGTGWAFGLVMLAALGVVLVSRGRFRRLVCVLGLLAAVGGVVAAADEVLNGADAVREASADLGIPDLAVRASGWLGVGAVAAVLALAGWVAAVAFVRRWPEMGKRYDTPVGDAPEDLWKALDHGHDPTS